MNIHSINSAVVTDASAVERTKPGRGDHGRAHHATESTDSFQGDFKSLVKAVQSGDLTSAQSAIDSLKGDVNGTSATYSPSSTAPSSPASGASTVGGDLQALFAAVQSGDVEGAQSALELFVSDARADGPHGGPSTANLGQSGLKIAQALHRHHQRLGLESLVASLFSSAVSVDPTASPETPVPDSTAVDSTTVPATDAPATAETPGASTAT